MRRFRVFCVPLVLVLVLACDGAGSSSPHDTDTTQEPGSGSRDAAPSGGDGGSTGGREDAGAQAGALLLDDFEDGDSRGIVPGSLWIPFDDSGGGGASVVLTPRDSRGGPQITGEGPSSARALELSMSFAKGTYEWQPFVGLLLHFAAPLDLRPYDVIRYAYRGPAHDVRLETPQVLDSNYFLFSVQASSEWKVIEIPVQDLKQADWGAAVDLDLSAVTALSYLVRGADGTAATLALDDIAVAPPSGLPAMPDMEILPPDPPVRTVVENVAIDHPLQQLAAAKLDRGANLTNWLEQGDFDGFTYDEQFVERLAGAGFGSLRLPIDLDRYAEGSAEALVVSEQLWTILDAFDTWTERHGLGFTIDYHQYDGSFDPHDGAGTARMAALWGAVAAHFAPRAREDIFYELLNEPELSSGTHTGATQAEWTEIASAMIAEIRRHDPRHPIIFGDVRWYDIDSLVQRTPFADPRIIYSFHFYEPFIFTHQGATWAGMAATHDLPFPYREERWSQYYRDFGFSAAANADWQIAALHNYHRDGTVNAVFNRIAEAKRWAVQHQVPLICNEFGAYDATARKEDRLAYYATLRDAFRELDIPWQLWFSVMNPATGAVDQDVAEALGLR